MPTGKIMAIEKIFCFPDNHSSKVGLRWTKKHEWEWFHDLATKAFTDSLEKDKKDQPRFGFWNSGGEWGIVCADIDSIPQGIESFDHLERELNQLLGNDFVVTRSSSGKVKIFGLAHFPTFNKITAYKKKRKVIVGIALGVWSRVLPPTIFKEIDTNPAPFSYSYINRRMLDDLRALSDRSDICKIGITEGQIQVMVTETGEIFELEGEVEIKKDMVAHKYKKHVGELPVFAQKFVTRYKSNRAEEREALMRILLFTPDLIEVGFDLPTTELANSIGTRSTYINRWINSLVKKGILQIQNSRFKRGKHAKRYLAGEQLLEFLKDRFGDKRRKKVRLEVVNYKLPKKIKDGEWNVETYNAIKYYFKDDYLGFMEWLVSLPGADKNNRVAEARARHQYYMDNVFRKYQDPKVG